jgi:hypothetical protein
MTTGFSSGRVFLMAYEKWLDVLLAYARFDVFLGACAARGLLAAHPMRGRTRRTDEWPYSKVVALTPVAEALAPGTHMLPEDDEEDQYQPARGGQFG